MANVPAEYQAYRGDDPPVAPSSGDRAQPVPDRLPPRAPRHQEDVVVDAQGDQEHEHEQRHGGIGARETEHVAEQQCRQPDAAPKDSTTVPMSRNAATTARSSNPRMSSTTSSTSGMITFRSRVAYRSTSELMAVAPPTFGVRPGNRVHGRAGPVDGGGGGRAVRLAGQRPLQVDRPSLTCGGAHRRDAFGAGERGPQLGRGGSVADDRDRLPAPPGSAGRAPARRRSRPGCRGTTGRW